MPLFKTSSNSKVKFSQNSKAVISSVDRDVKSFIQQSGATAKYEIDSFVKGIKDLGLWDSMVCWPLRSSQNAGSGTTVYSLGGLGTYNGTMVNGPTWGEDGIDFSPTQYISISSITTPPAWTAFTAFHVVKTEVSNSNSLYSGLASNSALNPATNSYLNFACFGPTGNRVLFITGLTGGDNGRTFGNANTTNVGIGYYYISAGISDLTNPDLATGFTELNGSRSTVLEGTGTLPRTATGTESWIFGTQSSSRIENGAIAIWFLQALTSVQIAQIQSLYKSTLGQGLGLP